MKQAYICDYIRTPIGRYGGALSAVRTDDLAALPIKALIERNPSLNLHKINDVLLGCANQAGEDNRNVARMAALLAGLPNVVSGLTVNRLCGSGMDAVAQAARLIKVAEGELVIAGGVESMSRAPFVMGKASVPFSRQSQMYDTTMGWRFINPKMQSDFGTDSMPETAENVAALLKIPRQAQDEFALRSQQLAEAAFKRGFFAKEIIPVSVAKPKGEALQVEHDEQPRPNTTLKALSALRTPFKQDGTVTAGNASGINDGACALLLASAEAMQAYELQPTARVVATKTVGVEPRLMGLGPVEAVKAVLHHCQLSLKDMDVIELNEAFAAQALGCLSLLNLKEDDPRINPNGGAIALGHPLGMSGARLIATAINQLQNSGGRYGLCCMCVGVGQGIAMVVEHVQAVLMNCFKSN